MPLLVVLLLFALLLPLPPTPAREPRRSPVRTELPGATPAGSPAWAEGFDSVPAPLLPPGWTTTTARDPGGDFLLTTSGAASAPNCAYSSNATVGQSLTSPPIDLLGRRSCSVEWSERRSASHDATVSLLASFDGGETFSELGDAPFAPPGGTSFVRRSVPLPSGADDHPGLVLRWAVNGDGTGATGTLRIDDVAVVMPPATAAPGSVVINEIMYDPLEGKAEYVELLNRTGAPIDLDGWRLVDDDHDSTGGRLEVTADPPASLLLPTGGFLVCSPDSAPARDYPSIPPGTPVCGEVRDLSLNNGGDLLILLDPSGGVIDRVAYDPGWHTPALDDTRGRALERIDPASPGSEGWNWGTSAGVDGGTPGAANSLVTVATQAGPRLECRPNPFSPDGDPFGALLPS